LKYEPARWLSVKGWRDLAIGESIPSYCEVCDRQRIHYVDGFAKRGPSVLVKLKCEHEFDGGSLSE
jgi:hypothetical protein